MAQDPEEEATSVPDTLVDDTALSGVTFDVRSGKAEELQSVTSSAKGLTRVAHEKAIEFAKRVRLGVSNGSQLEVAMENAFQQVYTPLEAAKYLVPGIDLLKGFWESHSQQVDDFFPASEQK
jgi:hypothetical protein